jgi:hypothetical protein
LNKGTRPTLIAVSLNRVIRLRTRSGRQRKKQEQGKRTHDGILTRGGGGLPIEGKGTRILIGIVPQARVGINPKIKARMLFANTN